MLFQNTLCIVRISVTGFSSYIRMGKPGPVYYGIVFYTGILMVKALTFTVRAVPTMDVVAIRITHRNSYQTQTFTMEFVHNFLTFLTLTFLKFCTEHNSDAAMPRAA